MLSAHLARAELIYPHASGEVSVSVVVALSREDGITIPIPRYEVTVHPPDDEVSEGVEDLISRLSLSVDRWGWEEDLDWGEGSGVQYANLTRGDDLWRLYCDRKVELRSVEVDSDLVGYDEDYYDADITPIEAFNAFFQAVHLSGATKEYIPLRLVKAAHRAQADRALGVEVARADSWALGVVAAAA